MGWSYRLVKPLEAAALMDDPGAYVPRTPLATYRQILDWFGTCAAGTRLRDSEHLVVPIGPDGYVVLHLVTIRGMEVLSAALRRSEASGDDFERVCYTPRDDENVVEIAVDGRGTGDLTILIRCADWLNAGVLDCQAGDMLTPDQWRARNGT